MLCWAVQDMAAAWEDYSKAYNKLDNTKQAVRHCKCDPLQRCAMLRCHAMLGVCFDSIVDMMQPVAPVQLVRWVCVLAKVHSRSVLH